MRAVIGPVAVALTAAACVLLGSAPAHAAPPSEIELSLDGGATWYTDSAPALFGDLGSLIPGTSQSASILVKNTSGTSAVLRVAQIVAVTSSPGLVADLEFTTSTTDVDGGTIGDVATGVCIPLLDGQIVGSGQVGTITLTVSLDPASGNDSRGGTAPVEFIVSLVENTGGTLPPVSCTNGASVGGNRPAAMANTGSDWMSTATIGGALAVTLLGGGMLLAVGARRRRTR